MTDEAPASLALRENVRRYAFLLKLSDTLRPLQDPLEVQLATMKLVVEHLDVMRASYLSIDSDQDGLSLTASYDLGTVPMPGHMRISDFAPEMAEQYRQGRTLFVEDSDVEAPTEAERYAYRSIGVRAGIGVPLVKNGTLLGIFGVHSATPRRWSDGDVQLLEDVGDRIWAAVDRARAEAAVRESEERQAFLLKLSDALRAEPSADAIANQAIRMLFDHMHLDRCYVGVYRLAEDVGHFPQQVHHDSLPPLPAMVRLSDFPKAMEVAFDQTLVVDDVANMRGLSDSDRTSFGALGFKALIAATLRKGENHPLWAIITVSTRPRAWTQGDVALVEEVAERTWAAIERARAETALRGSEARLAAAFEGVPGGAAVIDLAGKVVIGNAEFRRFLTTGVIPSHDAERGHRWRSWDARGAPLKPADFPGARALRGERVVPGVEMLYTDDDARDIWTSVAAVPIVDGHGTVTGEVVTITNIDALKRGTDALLESEARFRQFSDASTSILWIRDAATMRMEFASPAYDVIYGIAAPDRGGDPSLRGWARLIEPENRKAVLGNFRRVRAGERIEMEFRIRRASDGALRWIHNTDFPLRDAAGEVRWLAGIGADITDAKESTDRQGVLVAELQHRTRNLIAIVRALSDRTLSNAASLEDFGQRFRLRLSALSRVQGLLSNLAVGERVSFDELLRSELTAHGAMEGTGGKLTLAGPPGVPLRSSAVQTMALAIHELATNAVKYGALSAADGHLTVHWHVEPASGDAPPRLHVVWQESGVVLPQISEPARGGGYGRELIERALPYQLKATTSYEFGADGVRCTIVVPVSQATDD